MTVSPDIYLAQIPDVPIIGAGFAGTMDLIVAILGGVALSLAAVAAVFILIQPKGERGRAILGYGIAVIVSLFVSWDRGDWLVFTTVVLMLPVMLGIRWLYRRVGDRQRS